MSDSKRVSRRTAVSTMALATASFVVTGHSMASEDRRKKVVSRRSAKANVESLEEFFWHNAVDEQFSVRDYSWLESSDRPEPAQLTLKSVSRFVPSSDDSARPEEIRANAIFLLFEGREGLELESASYRMVHSNLGEFDLMLSMTKTRAGAVLYEAVLN